MWMLSYASNGGHIHKTLLGKDMWSNSLSTASRVAFNFNIGRKLKENILAIRSLLTSFPRSSNCKCSFRAISYTTIIRMFDGVMESYLWLEGSKEIYQESKYSKSEMNFLPGNYATIKAFSGQEVESKFWAWQQVTPFKHRARSCNQWVPGSSLLLSHSQNNFWPCESLFLGLRDPCGLMPTQSGTQTGVRGKNGVLPCSSFAQETERIILFTTLIVAWPTFLPTQLSLTIPKINFAMVRNGCWKSGMISNYQHLLLAVCRIQPRESNTIEEYPDVWADQFWRDEVELVHIVNQMGLQHPSRGECIKKDRHKHAWGRILTWGLGQANGSLKRGDHGPGRGPNCAVCWNYPSCTKPGEEWVKISKGGRKRAIIWPKADLVGPGGR